MSSVKKISSWLFNGKEEVSDSRPSWNWQAPTPFYSTSYRPETLAQDEPSTSTSTKLPTDRPTSVQSNFITKTTVYDPQTGGFITSVSTDTSDHALPVANSSPVDKQILSQNSYNTLTRKMKAKDNSGVAEAQARRPANKLSRSDPKGTVSGSLINQSSQYVTSIAVVSRQGSLLTLSSSTDLTSDTSDTEDSDNFKTIHSTVSNGHVPFLVNASNEFVANIQFGNRKSERNARKSPKLAHAGPDSLVTSTLLDLTRPGPEEQDRRAKLSGYILDEEGENSFDNQHDYKETEKFSNERISDDFDQPHLSATVLNKGDELNDLYRTISRKRILSKVHCSNFHLHNSADNHHGECNRKHSNMFGNQLPSQEEPPRSPSGVNLQRPTPRPLAKILDRLHSVNPNENTYVSLTGDSVYQSLSNQNPLPDDNNNKDKPEVLSACPVLVANILATHAETFRHATASGCADCFDYANSVGYALPYLEPRPMPEENKCKVHGHNFQEGLPPGGLSLSDIERGMQSRSAAKQSELSGQKESKIICYLAAVILAILVLIAVIVVLTMMVANKEMGKEIDF